MTTLLILPVYKDHLCAKTTQKLGFKDGQGIGNLVTR